MKFHKRKEAQESKINEHREQIRYRNHGPRRENHLEGGGGCAAFTTDEVAAGAVDFTVDAGAAAVAAIVGAARKGASGMMTRTSTDSFGGGSGCVGGSAPGALAARLTASASGITFRCTADATGSCTAFGSGGAAGVVAGTT